MSDPSGSRCGVGFNQVFRKELGYVRHRWRTVYGPEPASEAEAEPRDEAGDEAELGAGAGSGGGARDDGNRRRLADPPRPTTDNELVGLAFSGGGIRSATINLGIAQALHQRGVFDHADYLSTVSGGGYLGSAISTAMRTLPVADSGESAASEPDGGEPETSDRQEEIPPPPGVGEFPYALDFGEQQATSTAHRGSPFLEWIRNNSNYMATGGFKDYGRIAGVLLRGILANFLILVPILLVLAAGLFWRYDDRLDAWWAAVETAQAAEKLAGELEAAADRAAAVAEESVCQGAPACAERAQQAADDAAAARPAASQARAAVPPRSQFFTVAPFFAGLFVFMVLVFPVMIRVFKVFSHGKLVATGEESSVEQRSQVELAFGFALIAIGVSAALEAMPILIHYFHRLQEVGLRGAYAGAVSGGALGAITVVSRVLSKLGGLKQKLLLTAVGLLGLVIPLVILLYVTEGLVYGGWSAIQPFQPLPLRAALGGTNPFWIAPGVLLLILGGGFGAVPVGKWWKWRGRTWATVAGIALGVVLFYFLTGWLSTLLAWISCWIPGTAPDTVRPDIFILGVGGVIWFFCWWAVDINLTSVLGLYRDRLASAYLIGLRWLKMGDKLVRDADGKPIEELFVEPDLNLEDLCGGTPPAQKPEKHAECPEWKHGVACHPSKAPYHIVNTSLNLQGSDDPMLRDRNSDFFMFSKYYFGGLRTGYCTTNDMEQVFPQMDLQTAMAISAAAASPNAGRMTSKPLVALMTLLNIRLGYWVPHPGRLCQWLSDKRRQAGDKPFEPTLFHRFIWRVPPRAFLREMFSLVDEKHWWVNLSDGGHIENLAVYELLRRRCRYIICGDGEADPGLTFGSLATLMRFARIDLGVEIEILLDDLRLDADGYSHQHAALGRIFYPGAHRQVRAEEAGECDRCGAPLKPLEEAPRELRGTAPGGDETGFYCPKGEPEPGYLLYIKSSFTANEDETMQEYRANNPDFPHESTADQFFDEGQFEAYRALGFHMADGLFPPLRPGEDPKTDWAGFKKWFDALRADLAPRLSAKRGALQEQLRRIQELLQRPRYREYFYELNPRLEGDPERDGKRPPLPQPELLYLVGQQLALMEDAFISLNLDQPQNWNHESNQGWRQLFSDWACSKSFKIAYESLSHLHSGRFQNFCHRAFGLSTAAELAQRAQQHREECPPEEAGD